jgi:dolichol-phosphate mannosyltransferase
MQIILTSAMQESLTILVPVYNESECLCHLVNELKKFMLESPIDASVLFINDGSSDNSQELISTVCSNDWRFHFIQLKNNQGLSGALKAGFDRCQSSLVGYIDADCQTSAMDFLKLLQYIPAYDMVTGIRVKRNDSLLKRISSTIANNVRRWMIHDGIVDTGCPLKIIKTEYAKSIPFFKGMHRFLPALIQLQGGSIKQVDVQHFPRFAGKAKYNLGNRLIGPFVDAWAMRWMQKRHIHYTIAKEA